MSLYTVFQPIWELKSNSVHGYEALLRGNASPRELYKRAAESNKIQELDYFAHDLALSTFSSSGVGLLFLNIHPKSLEYGFKMDFRNYNIEPSNIVFEITEHEMLNEFKVKERIREIRNIGCKIAIDDFGHGFTNLSLIEWTEPSYIKLDKTLIKDIHSKTLPSLLKGLNEIAKGIGSELVAEGIETKEQLEFVKYCNIKYGQGFLLGRPMSLKEIKISC